MNNQTIKIDGKKLALPILKDLKNRVKLLKKQNKIIPQMAVVYVGDDPASKAYINQKKRIAIEIGAKLATKPFDTNVLFQELAEIIQILNFDLNVHGLVVQRPLPATLATATLNTAVIASKDIDGFREKSPFLSPIAQAVFHTLKAIYEKDILTPFLKTKNILLIGRGETGGIPISAFFNEKKIPFIIANSQTENTAEFAKEADIIISAVGKPRIVKADMLKEGVVLIGVGLCRDKHGKLQGDYNETEISSKASYYTPTPGGIGPLNVAFLMRNLVIAAERQSEKVIKRS